MSTTSSSSSSSSPFFFHELKKQASFYLKEKIKTARLALTDVTPAQITTEEATNGNPGATNAKTLGFISRAAFEVDDYWRIVEILHTRLSRFDRNNWRSSYKALIVLEHLVTHGPESVAREFQEEREAIKQMQSFQHIDEKGFNWGLAVRKKSVRVLDLLEMGPLLREEKNRARKLTRGIQGFGSLTEKRVSSPSTGAISRSHSQFNEHGNQDESLAGNVDDRSSTDMRAEGSKKLFENTSGRGENGTAETPSLSSSEFHKWNEMKELNGLLDKNNGGMVSFEEQDHSFAPMEKESKMSLLAVCRMD